jgi:hypothetical protein
MTAFPTLSMNEDLEAIAVELLAPSVVEVAFKRMSAVLEAKSVMNVVEAVRPDTESEVEATAA